MSRRWMMGIVLLCPACASQPAPPDGGKSLVEISDPPATGAPRPNVDDPEDQAPAEDPPDPADTTASDDTGPVDLDCNALWLVAGHVGCVVAKLVCAAVENLPLGNTTLPCDVAVPVACGIVTAATEAAAAACEP